MLEKKIQVEFRKVQIGNLDTVFYFYIFFMIQNDGTSEPIS